MLQLIVEFLHYPLKSVSLTDGQILMNQTDEPDASVLHYTRCSGVMWKEPCIGLIGGMERNFIQWQIVTHTVSARDRNYCNGGRLDIWRNRTLLLDEPFEICNLVFGRVLRRFYTRHKLFDTRGGKKKTHTQKIGLLKVEHVIYSL